MNIQEQITKEITQNLSNKFDEILIEGLRLKGYSFETLEETMAFVKENCHCADHLPTQQKTFYVKDVPFLLHDYSETIEPIDYTKKDITITATYGSYKYL